MLNFFKTRSAQCWLALAAAILLFGLLGSKGIWTQEYRWQQVCLHMLSSGDYWHPYLDGKPYYDKPLLTYWFIIALVKLSHSENFANALLRIPSAIAGCLVLWSTYQLNKKFFDEKTALLSSWMLLTTFYFVFWARVASADMWNVAGIMLSILWFFNHLQHATDQPLPLRDKSAGLPIWTHAVRAKPEEQDAPSHWSREARVRGIKTFLHHLIFFSLLALSALLKGLIAPVLVFLVLFPTLLKNKRYVSFLKLPSLLAILIAAAIYITPFLISSYTQHTYAENGLLEVFRENVLRFFAPFDHTAPWYTYFLYFPIYVLVWTPLLVLALVHLSCQRRLASTLNEGKRFFLWAVFSIFIFLSLSGSRRSYYILPIVPFAISLTSAWWQKNYGDSAHAQKIMRYVIGVVYVLLCGYFLIFETLYYQLYRGGC